VFADVINRPGWLRDLCDLAFPPLCLGCGEYVDSSRLVCDSCLKRIHTYPQPFCLNCFGWVVSGARCEACRDDSFVAYVYADYLEPLRNVIIDFKFHGISRAAGLFAEWLCESFEHHWSEVPADLLVPVPLHPSREHTRGFNQAEMLAKELSSRIGLPVATEILMRTKRRRPQSRLSEQQRKHNIAGVFAVDLPAQAGERVILVDDVITSGQTVREARRVLVRAGYAVPAVIAAAHGA
jgi:ComF family protein